MTEKVLILGAGSWGITLANLIAAKRIPTSLWEFNPEQAKHLRTHRKLPVLPQLRIYPDIKIDFEMNNLVEDNQTIIFALPSQCFRTTVQLLKKSIKKISKPVISVTKGIEQDTLMRMSEIIISEMPEAKDFTAVLSGPSHAEEVSKKVPTAVAVAAYNHKTAKKIQELFFNKYFRVYTQTDIIGVEMGGALKNIYAIGAGICDGLRLGDNTKAALITRGIAEIIRLAKKMGANEKTFSGLSGIGDLMVTCFSQHSRNRLLGEKIGTGKSVAMALSEMLMVAEGYPTTKSAYQMSHKHKIELPILNEIYETLYNNKLAYETIDALMNRSAKSEMEETEAYYIGGEK